MRQMDKSSDQKISYTPILVTMLIVASFLIGSLTTKLQMAEKGSITQQVQGAQVTPAQQAPAAPPAPKITLDTIKNLFVDKNIHFGNANNKNLIVEVADPSCPWCHVAAGKDPELSAQMGKKPVSAGGDYLPPLPEIKKLVDAGKASFVWIYTPGHGNGEMGTKALYCANEQGKFWEAHDKIMSNDGYNLLNNDVKNDKTKSQTLVDFLASAVDPTQLKTCIDSGKYDTKLQDDIKIATSLGITGTPGFFINATAFPGAYSWKDMESSIKN